MCAFLHLANTFFCVTKKKESWNEVFDIIYFLLYIIPGVLYSLLSCCIFPFFVLIVLHLLISECSSQTACTSGELFRPLMSGDAIFIAAKLQAQAF